VQRRAGDAGVLELAALSPQIDALTEGAEHALCDLEQLGAARQGTEEDQELVEREDLLRVRDRSRLEREQ